MIYPLIDILKLVMLAVLCGMDELDTIINYCKNKREFLEKRKYHILDVTYEEDRCKLLTQMAQENINILRKMGVHIHKNYLKKSNQACSIVYLMISFYLNYYKIVIIAEIPFNHSTAIYKFF